MILDFLYFNAMFDNHILTNIFIASVFCFPRTYEQMVGIAIP